MLDDWEENLAVITANRTKDDHLVIMHLGDCLWRERSEVYIVVFNLVLFHLEDAFACFFLLEEYCFFILLLI